MKNIDYLELLRDAFVCLGDAYRKGGDEHDCYIMLDIAKEMSKLDDEGKKDLNEIISEMIEHKNEGILHDLSRDYESLKKWVK